MKMMVLKLITILAYILILLYFLQFDIMVLFGLKELVFTVFGSVMLSLPYYDKKKTMHELSGILGRNALVTSYLATFILLFTRMSKDIGYENLLPDIALACRPLLYGFVLYILLHKEDEYKGSVKASGVKNEEEKPKYTMEQIHVRLEEMGLTRREVEVAICIHNGFSNREIAEELYISETTVKKHVTHIFGKLGIAKREQIKELINAFCIHL